MPREARCPALTGVHRDQLPSRNDGGTAVDVVNSYYDADRSVDKEAIRTSVLGDDVSLDSPLVIEEFHEPVVGKA